MDAIESDHALAMGHLERGAQPWLISICFAPGWEEHEQDFPLQRNSTVSKHKCGELAQRSNKEHKGTNKHQSLLPYVANPAP